MTRAKAAAAADFDGFYQAHFGDTVAMTFSFTADLGEAQDITQEAFTRAWQRWTVVSTYDNPLSWVRRVATNLAHSRWRRLKVATAYLVRQRTEDLPELSPDSVDVVTALKRLPVTQRKAIVLHYLLDLPIHEVASELGAPEGTIKSWLHRGRASLTVDLGDEVRRNVSPQAPQDVRKKGDKRQRNKRTGIVAASALVVLSVILAFSSFRILDPSPLPPATPIPVDSLVPSPEPGGLPYDCVGQSLPVPEGFTEQNSVQGADPTGRWLVGKVKLGNETRLVIWRDAVMQAAFEMPGGNVDLNDVNSKGVAVGTTLDGGENVVATAWIYDGKLRKLTGTHAMANAINEAGTIVGSVQDRPAVWRPGKTNPEYLPLPPGERVGSATGLTEDGVIVGVVGEANYNFTDSGVPRAFAWYPDGTSRELLPGNGLTWTRVYHAAGKWAIGSASSGSTGRTVLWDLTTGKPVLDQAAYAQRTNAQGWLTLLAAMKDMQGNQTELRGRLDGKLQSGIQVDYFSDDGTRLAGQVNGVPVTWQCKAGS